MAGWVTSLYVCINWLWALCLPPPTVFNSFMDSLFNELEKIIDAMLTDGKQQNMECRTQILHRYARVGWNRIELEMIKAPAILNLEGLEICCLSPLLPRSFYLSVELDLLVMPEIYKLQVKMKKGEE